MALGTILSRITGFIRAVLGVAVLGTALLADTYNVANTMPNILYNLLVGGALTAIFVPQLVRSFSDEDGGHGFASRLVTTISGNLVFPSKFHNRFYRISNLWVFYYLGL